MTCTRKIGPFGCCSVVQGDCLELMRELPDGCVDAVITDPPYGIGYDRNVKHKGNRNNNLVIGDDAPFNPVPLLRFPHLILWGANCYASRLPDSKTWLTWRKTFTDNEHGQTADCELAWSNCIGRSRFFQYLWAGCYRDGETGDYFHPTQKPVALMEWCIDLADASSVLDPYCGSGSTLVAAKKLGRHFLGFEISPEYCRIARERLARIDAQPNLFAKPAEQLTLQ